MPSYASYAKAEKKCIHPFSYFTPFIINEIMKNNGPRRMKMKAIK